MVRHKGWKAKWQMLISLLSACPSQLDEKNFYIKQHTCSVCS